MPADWPDRLLKSLTTAEARARLKHLAKAASNVQRPTRGDNVFIFSTPRSGSTWLMETILSQPGFRACDQPFDIRNPYVQIHLGVSTWDELYQKDTDDRLKPYLQAICDGRLRGLTTLWNGRRLLSRRLVFKIQNGWQERVAWIRDTVGGRVVLLLRHPIATTLSRKRLPRLEAFVQTDYARHFGDDVRKLAVRIVEKGSFFEQGVLHWCFETAWPLRTIEPDWIVLSYEQMVVDPETVLTALAAELKLPDLPAMRNQVGAPSRTISMSSAETRSLVEGGERDRLISKWRRQISDAEERAAFDILEVFGVEAYRFGQDMPIDAYRIGPDRVAAPALVPGPARPAS